MEPVTIRIEKRRYDALASAAAALLDEYGVAGPPGDDFAVETLDGVGAFDQFDIVRDFAVRLDDARPVGANDGDDGDDGSNGDDGGDGDDGDDPDDANDADAFEVEVHAHHLVALVAAFPDLTGAAAVPEPDLSVAVQGLCYAYLEAVAEKSRDREA